MRNFKRFLAMTLTMLMVVGSFAMLTSAKFDDVTDFQNEITVLSNLGVIKGKADGTYGFDEQVTRRQMTLFFARANTGKVDDAVWSSTVNNTQFKDLDAKNDYYGSISYCANLGIVKGKSATEFFPNDGILFQEAITMAVRALGFETKEMNAGYPYTYYNKAISLGLDKGIDNIALTDVVSRGVAAKLIYNTMFTKNADGSTMATYAFGATVKDTNVVIIASEGKKITNVANADKNYVKFCEIKADGTFDVANAMNMKWADFVGYAGLKEDAKSIDFVGHSFNVVTTDGYKTFATATENPSKTFSQKDADGSNKIDGVEYNRVSKWNNDPWSASQIMWFNTASSIGKNTVGEKDVYFGGVFYRADDDNNILKTDGGRLLTFMGDKYIKDNKIVDKKVVTDATLWNFSTMYAYVVGDYYTPAYPSFDGSVIAGAALSSTDYVKNDTSYSQDAAGKYTTNVSAYADTTVFDDNNDGKYDRAYFTNYTFGQFFSFSKDGNNYYNVTLGAKGPRISSENDIDGAKRGYKNISVNNISGKEVKNGDYVLWARDALNGNLIIKKVYDKVETGYVTGVNVFDKTLSIIKTLPNFGIGTGAGETLKYGVAKLPGAANTNNNLTINDNGTGDRLAEDLIGISYKLQFKSISYIVDDEHENRIIAIIGEKNADTALVVTSVDSGYNSLGYVRANVIDQNGTMQIINISKIDNAPVFGWFNNVNLANGQLVFGAKQDDNTWMIETANKAPYNYKTVDDIAVINELTFNGGYAYENLTTSGVDKKILDNSGKTTFTLQPDNGKLVIVVATKSADGKTLTYQIANGIPANGSILTVSANTSIYAKNGYMYVMPNANGATGATFGPVGWNFTNGWQVGAVSDVIYLESAGLIGAGYPIGGMNNPGSWQTYNYTYAGNYWSVLTGDKNNDIGAYINSNFVLTNGKFYEVTKAIQNGTTVINVVGEVTMTDNVVYIQSFDSRSAVITDENGKAPSYYSTGKEVKVVEWKNGNRGDAITAPPAVGKLYKAFTYEDSNINGGKKFYFVTKTIDYTVPTTKAITGVEIVNNLGVKVVNPVEGETLFAKVTTTDGTFFSNNTPAGFTIEWTSGSKTAITATYTVEAGDNGKEISVKVTLTGYANTANTAKTGNAVSTDNVKTGTVIALDLNNEKCLGNDTAYTITANTITYTKGEVPYSPTDIGIGRMGGYRVPIKIQVPNGVNTLNGVTVTINGNNYNPDNFAEYGNAFYCWPLVTNAGATQTITVTVKWDSVNTQNFNIVIDKAVTFGPVAP